MVLNTPLPGAIQHMIKLHNNTICLTLLAVLAAPVWAQSLSVGIRAGVPASDAFDTLPGPLLFRNVPHHWTAGPTLEVHLPFSLGVTLDALYSRVEFERVDGTGSETGGQWEFPLMLRYRTSSGTVQPFIAGGGSFNTLTDITAPTSNAAGLVLGAGIEIHIPIIRITPEFRYTRRFSDQLDIEGLRSNRNQLVFLTGITF
jgi:hypothetical protein